MRHPSFRILVVVLFTIAVLAPPRAAHASPQDILYTYWTGNCSTGVTNVGWKRKLCNGTITTSGQQSGTWMKQDILECPDPDDIYYEWYEWCDNDWVYRYSGGQHPTTQCQCS